MRKGTVLFRVEFFVDDKRLGAALIALIGLSNGQPSVQPVVNAVAKGRDKKVEAIIKGGSSLERFAEHLKDFKGKTINADDARGMMKEIGLATTSYTYMLERGRAAGLIKKHGKGSGTSYTVL